jgi:hypothetical protein
VVFVRGFLIRRDDEAEACGRVLWAMDGELDGDADMRVSRSAPSSSGFRFRPVIVVDGAEYAARLLIIPGAEGRLCRRAYLERGTGGLGGGAAVVSALAGRCSSSTRATAAAMRAGIVAARVPLWQSRERPFAVLLEDGSAWCWSAAERDERGAGPFLANS